MFEVTATTTFLKADGSQAKDPYSRSWTGLEKESVVDHLEARMLKALSKLNSLSTDVIHGNAPRPETTNPVEMRMEVVFLEDGAKWHRSVFEWPHMGIEQQEMLLGMFNGELSNLPSELKNKEIKNHGKSKK